MANAFYTLFAVRRFFIVLPLFRCCLRIVYSWLKVLLSLTHICSEMCNHNYAKKKKKIRAHLVQGLQCFCLTPQGKNMTVVEQAKFPEFSGCFGARFLRYPWDMLQNFKQITKICSVDSNFQKFCAKFTHVRSIGTIFAQTHYQTTEYHQINFYDYWIKITLAKVLSKSHCPTKWSFYWSNMSHLRTHPSYTAKVYTI